MDVAALLIPILVILGTVGLAVGAHWAIRSRLGYNRLSQHNDVAGYVFSAVGVIYAVVLGFVVVVVWEKYDEAAANTNNEVAAVADLYRVAAGLPPKLRAHVRGEVGKYIVYVVGREWPDMGAGKNPDNVSPLLEHLGGDIAHFEPATAGQEDAHQAALVDMQHAFDTRRLRVERSYNDVPPILWFALIFGAAATLASLYFFSIESRAAQISMTAILASTIAVMFVVIYEFSAPFSGVVHVSDTGWIALLARLPLIH